jgi:hypothetical protein
MLAENTTSPQKIESQTAAAILHIMRPVFKRRRSPRISGSVYSGPYLSCRMTGELLPMYRFIIFQDRKVPAIACVALSTPSAASSSYSELRFWRTAASLRYKHCKW